GTGTFAMASRRVEITGNTYENNDSVDIAIISGLVVDAEPATWDLETANLVGQWDDLGLLEGTVAGTIGNYRTESILIANNTHVDSGDKPDGSKELGLGLLALYAGAPVSSVVYDTTGESDFN